MYSVSDYGGMLADQGRMQPYVRALQKHISPDSVVMDIGTGTGVFALLACKLGARHVYAIETNDAIEVAKKLAVANGYSEKITFIHDASTRISIPEKADIIVSDLRGELPLCTQNIPSIIDARKRHLADSGVLIPARDHIRVAIVESPSLSEYYTQPWRNNEYGLDLQAALPWVNNTLWTSGASPGSKERIVGEEKDWRTLDYYSIDSPNISGKLTWVLEENVTIHGVRIWFDTELAGGIGFSNHPSEKELVYGSIFLPFTAPVSLEVREVLALNLQAKLVGNDYIWRWRTTACKQENLSEPVVDYDQSSFKQTPVVVSQLRKRGHSFEPELAQEGEFTLAVLLMMEQGMTLQSIAHSMAARFPNLYPNWQDALPPVGELSVKYSK